MLSPSSPLVRSDGSTLSRAAWLRRCRPLLAYLSSPRTLGDLQAWAGDRSMSAARLEAMLAWLEGDGDTLHRKGASWART